MQTRRLGYSGVWICLNPKACIITQGLRVCLMLFSLTRNGFTLLENQIGITCFGMRMSPYVHVEVRTTSLSSCSWLLLLAQGLMERECIFYEKIGCFPLVTYECAKRSSVNRRARTIEVKPITSFARDVIRKFMIEKVLPAIREK